MAWLHLKDKFFSKSHIELAHRFGYVESQICCDAETINRAVRIFQNCLSQKQNPRTTFKNIDKRHFAKTFL